jgi:hypothetical protein
VCVIGVVAEAEHRSTFYIPYWNVPLLRAIVPRQRAFAADLAVINSCLDGLIAQARASSVELSEEDLQNRDYSKVRGLRGKDLVDADLLLSPTTATTTTTTTFEGVGYSTGLVEPLATFPGVGRCCAQSRAKEMIVMSSYTSILCPVLQLLLLNVQLFTSSQSVTECRDAYCCLLGYLCIMLTGLRQFGCSGCTRPFSNSTTAMQQPLVKNAYCGCHLRWLSF